MNGKDNIFLLLILRIREGRTHVLHNEIRIEPFRGNSVQACLSEVAADRDRSKSRHVQLGLLIYQTHLAHHTFQGVKCTSPTGWSDSHLSIAVNKYWLLRRTAFQSNVHYSGKQHSGYQIWTSMYWWYSKCRNKMAHNMYINGSLLTQSN